jgi:transposase
MSRDQMLNKIRRFRAYIEKIERCYEQRHADLNGAENAAMTAIWSELTRPEGPIEELTVE